MVYVMQVCFVLCSARDKDMPIVFASPCFEKLTGYSPNEVIGKNCRYVLADHLVTKTRVFNKSSFQAVHKIFSYPVS